MQGFGTDGKGSFQGLSKMDNKTLSIIVPIYNVEWYLGRCLDSLIKTEGIENTEIILVDDGSADSSGIIAESYAGKYDFITCTHKENGGLSDARNYGLKLAAGKYVFFCDPDDMTVPGGLAKVIETLSQSDVDILLFNGTAINEDDYEIDDAINKVLACSGLEADSIMTGVQAMVKQIEDHNKPAVTAWLRACRRDYLIDNGFLFETGLIHEDELWTPVVMLSASKVLYIPEKVYCYRLREKSIMSASGGQEKHAEAYVHIMNSLYDLYMDKTISEAQRDILLNNWAETYMWLIMEYEINKYECRKDIPGAKIMSVFKSSKEKLKSSLLTCFGVKNYCRIMWRRRRAKAKASEIKRLAEYKNTIVNFDAVMFNSPTYWNLGDQAVFLAEQELCSSLEIRMLDQPITDDLISAYADATPKDKLILISGGGNIGELWPVEDQKIRDIISYFRDNKIIIFPQTVYWDLGTEDGRKSFELSKECYMSHPDLLLFVRDKKSYEFMKNNMPYVKTELAPDMAMLLERKTDQERNGVLLCLRDDKEKILKKDEVEKLISSLRGDYCLSKTDTCFQRVLMPDMRNNAVDLKIRKFASSKLVITDRLHGMIFAYITKTPCIAIDSLSHKISGSYEWIKNAGFIRLAKDTDEIPSLICEVLKAENDSEQISCGEKLKKALEDAVGGHTD